MSTHTRKQCRSGHPCEPASLTEAIACVGQHSALSLAQLADRVGKSESTLGHQCSPYDEDHRLPLRDIVPLTMASGNDAIVRHLAAAVGGVFFRVPVTLGVAGDLEQIARVVRAFGELLEASAAASADGTVTEMEADRVAREAHDVIGAIAAYVSLQQDRARLRRVG